MPTFPVYPGELPTCLNPWNLRHYLLLAYWVFYRPTALKCYLYQIDPDLYRTEGGIGNFLKTFRYPAYRNLYLFIPLTALFLAFLIAGIPALIYWFQGGCVVWLIWASRVASGVVIGVASGVAIGVASGVAIGVAFGVAIGVAFGVALGVASSVPDMAYEVAYGGFVSVALGMALGTALGIAFGAAFCVFVGMTNGVANGVDLGMGLLGLPTYLLLLLGSVFCDNKPDRHPMMWSELHILPLPFTDRAIQKILQKSEINGFKQITSIVTNPFQYASLQRVLQKQLHEHSSPIHYLYHLLQHCDLESYVFAPSSEAQWRDIPTVRELFLGEIAGNRVKALNDDWYVYQLTKFLRDRRSTPLTHLARSFYILLQFAKAPDRSAYIAKGATILPDTEGLVKYPGGAEIHTSHILFSSSLECEKIEDIPTSQLNPPFPYPEPSTAIRPTIITAQLQLQSIAQDIQSALTMTSRVNQLAAYARANDDLQKLAEYITENTLKPEQSILSLIVEHWTEIIIAASGAIARTEITEPVANPYVAGNPVTGDIFVGRTDILRRIEELWMAAKPPSLVIYGHRRMGKSSILLNLQGKLNKDTILIDFNMQRVGLVDNAAELLHNLAVRLYDALEPSVRATWAEPEFAAFSSGNVYSAFDRFLTQLDRYRNGKRFAIAIDEFELIETQIEQGILEPRLLSYLLGILQTYPWLFFAFAGLHTLEEMTRNYWEPLFAKVTRISVSFLEPAAARQLITQPTPDFNLDYAEDAIELIIQLTAGQPYLIQLICLRLVSYFNDRNFISPTSNTANQDRDKSFRFSTEDVEAAIQHNEFESNGSAYFRAIWDRADSNQQLILQQLVNDDLSWAEIQNKLQITPEQLHTLIENLRSHDVLSIQQDKYTYCVPLMRRWVGKYKSVDLRTSV
jgi:AAA+ ATPase superfamily predicted ATPase